MSHGKPLAAVAQQTAAGTVAGSMTCLPLPSNPTGLACTWYWVPCGTKQCDYLPQSGTSAEHSQPRVPARVRVSSQTLLP